MTQRLDRGLLPAHLGQTNWHTTRYNDLGTGYVVSCFLVYAPCD